MFVVNYRKLFFTLSILLVVGSFVAISVYGLNFGIDFKGGSILEVSYPDSRPEAESIKVGLAISKNLKTVEEKHLVTPFNAKAMALFPEKITGKIWAILTVHTDKPPAKICLASFDKARQGFLRTFYRFGSFVAN